MGNVSTLHKVREHMTAAAKAHRQTREDALRAAAVAKAESDAQAEVGVPQDGLQGPEEGFWALGEAD